MAKKHTKGDEKREQARTTIKKRVALEQMRLTLGNATVSCQKTGISRKTLYEWMNEDSKFRDDVLEIDERAIDYTESKLLFAIKKGNIQAITFFLKTKGAKRGYAEKPEVLVNTAIATYNMPPLSVMRRFLEEEAKKDEVIEVK